RIECQVGNVVRCAPLENRAERRRGVDAVRQPEKTVFQPWRGHAPWLDGFVSRRLMVKDGDDFLHGAQGVQNGSESVIEIIRVVAAEAEGVENVATDLWGRCLSN